MTVKTKTIIIRTISGIFGAISFYLIIYFWYPIDFVKLLFALVPLIIFTFISHRLTKKKFKEYIETSENPRKTFWKLFRENELEPEDLNNIPPLKPTLESFQEYYNFFDKNKKKIRFCINQFLIRIQDNFGKFATYDFKDIENIYINARIDNDGDGHFPRLSLEIDLRNKRKVSCDIINVDYEIDELEQIIEYFRKNTCQHLT